MESEESKTKPKADAFIKLAIALSMAFGGWVSLAALIPVSPINGVSLSLVPEAQKRVMALPTQAERIALFAEDRKNGKVIRHDKYWHKNLPVVLKLTATKGEAGPWKVLVGKKRDLTDARVWYLGNAKVDKATGREGGPERGGSVVTIELPLANLEIATRYYWKVVCRGRCGFGCGPHHDCAPCKIVVESPVADFVTEDCVPRWIALEGRTGNFRDFGGRIGLDGRRVRQGLAYRGQGLNENSITGEVPGPNRLTVEDVRYLTQTLGIRTDLDLRCPGETAGLVESPLGPDVRLIVRSSSCYKGIFSESGKKKMAANFRDLCRRENYPMYFHCIGGADRTGSLAYVMNIILGVSRQEAETDWESTFYPKIPDENPDPDHWCRLSHINNGISKYGASDDTWMRRVELYLLDCGVTWREIETFRQIMLEP